jgi:hypothetical protein
LQQSMVRFHLFHTLRGLTSSRSVIHLF